MRFWKRWGKGSFSYAAWTGRIRTAVPLVAGIVLTILAVSVARQRITNLEQEIRERNTPVEIVVASEEIPEGGVISVNNLSKKEVPSPAAGRRNIPAGEFERVLGSRVRGNLGAGEPILWSDLEDPSAEQRFSRTIPAGRRAVTVDADPLSSFAGLLRPGDRLDILYEPEAGSGFRPLLYDVPVLAVDRFERIVRDGDAQTEFSTLTLSLLPAEGARIASASRTGKVSYLLRNPNDHALPTGRARGNRKRSRVEIWKGGIPVGRITVPGGAS